MSEELADVIEIVLANIPIDTGFMARTAPAFFETPYEITVIYSGVDYLEYNEEGTIYTQKNKGFISKKTTGLINRYGWSKSLGLPLDKTENNEALLENQDKLLEELGVIERV